MLNKGKSKACAVIECYQEIPCNPCTTVCPQGAISKEGLTSLPELNEDLCSGCGLCVAVCPGQAIYLQKDEDYSEFSTITFPWEYGSLPHKGETVMATNRDGEILCQATVHRVGKPERHNGTALLTLMIPREFKSEARSMKRKSQEMDDGQAKRK